MGEFRFQIRAAFRALGVCGGGCRFQFCMALSQGLRALVHIRIYLNSNTELSTCEG